MTQKQKTHHLAVAAMLTAVAAVLQFIEFSVPLVPSFIKLDISDLPALLGTFSLGPVYGVAIQLVKNLLHLPFGSSAGVGELSNFLLGATFAFIAGIIYKKHKQRSGALWGSLAGAAAMALISLPLNYFIVYPAYVVLYGLPLDAIVGMYQEILGAVAQVPTGMKTGVFTTPCVKVRVAARAAPSVCSNSNCRHMGFSFSSAIYLTTNLSKPYLLDQGNKLCNARLLFVIIHDSAQSGNACFGNPAVCPRSILHLKPTVRICAPE